MRGRGGAGPGRGLRLSDSTCPGRSRKLGSRSGGGEDACQKGCELLPQGLCTGHTFTQTAVRLQSQGKALGALRARSLLPCSFSVPSVGGAPQGGSTLAAP